MPGIDYTPLAITESQVQQYYGVKNKVVKCKLQYVSATEVKIGTGFNINNNGNVYELSSEITLDITGSGAGGLDSGSEANSTIYYVYTIINDTTTTIDGIISASATTPVIPSGWSKLLRVASFINDAGGDILRFTQTGTENERKYFLYNFLADCQVLSGGAAHTETPVSCSNYVSAIATKFEVQMINNDASYACYFYNPAGNYMGFIAKTQGALLEFSNEDSEQFTYKYSFGGNLSAYVKCYTEEL